MIAPATRLGLDDFTADSPGAARGETDVQRAGLIDGVTITPLAVNSDPRGSLSELLTARDGPIEPIVHIYQVTAPAGSIRAWVYHRHQFDRLAFGTGRFEVVLYDIRSGSATANRLDVFHLGLEQPVLLRIPPFVVHGVRNIGSETATFVNMPTRTYDPGAPDKYRLNWDDPRIPFRFDGR
ncbi:MAG: dTDP-4-dehydrorhamnose 3,5-epimerase [Hyphomicrobiales bacterium]|jgi:dTDP-4-dehydrorhamnose 3,5-epimerase|nr:dTDP-4-dehydrorhamnose 3,5-epimerase [Hyphomicrobiales bacterium]